MLTKTKLALAAALLVGTASFAAAEGYDSNLANRYPAYTGPVVTQGAFQSAPVGLRGQNAGQTQRNGYGAAQQDHAASPNSGF